MRANPEALDCYASTNLGTGATPSDSDTDCASQAIANSDRTNLDQLADSSDSLITPVVCIANKGGGNRR
ncbi:MAG: hypothetical protein R3F37_04005 [Candidatus Competibacteraceae bacterium]